jgi:hypothetical protein
MDSKQCLECGREFFGRADKKFCADPCRNAYNNRTYAAEEAIVKKVNRVLRKNWQILKSLNPEDKVKVSRDRLAKKGFDFDSITSILVTKEGKTYKFCYDQGYLTLSDDYLLLVKRFEE